MSSPHPPAPYGRGFARAVVIAAFAGLPLLAVAPGASAQPADEPAEVPTVVLTKTYQPRDPDPAPGEVITFTVTLANESGADATGYVIEGLIPPQVVDANWTCTANGAGSACGVDSGVGDLHDTMDVGAGGSVVYMLTGTIAADWEGTFIQAVTLMPGPGQACEPVFVIEAPDTPAAPDTPDAPAIPDAADSPEQYGDGDGYGYPPPSVEEMTCRVNNQVNPQALTVTPPESDPGAPELPSVPAVPELGQPPAAPPGLPVTGTRVAVYTLGGIAAALLGAGLVWFTRRRSAGGSPAR